MNILLSFDEFLDEEFFENIPFDELDESMEILNEDTIEGYKYHFTFEGTDYTIRQGKKDETIFGIKHEGKWKVLTKGRLFDPRLHDMHKNEMTNFIQKGIKYFNIRGNVDVDTVKESQWAKFFKFEIAKKPGRINKKYVILKLHAGKASAKYWAKKNKENGHG